MATYTYANFLFDDDGDGEYENTSTNYTVTEGTGADDDGVLTVGEVVTVSDNQGEREATYLGIDSISGNPVFDDGNGIVEVSDDDLTDSIGKVYTISEEDTPLLCFMAGTMVTTPEGSKAVEELSIDDAVVTSSGEVSRVKFVGIQTMDKFTVSTNRLPVCIRKDALAPNVPNKDLYVSADHAMYVDGILAHAGALVNGISICRVERSELEQNFTYYHVELEDHSLVLADNAPAETFVDNVTREKFNNYKEYIGLYGENENNNLTGELELPRAMSSRQLPKAIKERLEKRALELFGNELSHTA